MARLKQIVGASAIALALSGTSGGVIFGQDADAQNNVASLKQPRQLSNINAIAQRARAHVNPLAAQDTSNAFASTSDGIYAPGAKTGDGPAEQTYQARAFGTFGIPYTTTRVQVGNQSAPEATVDNYLSTTYPYRAVGKLFFQVGAGSSHCSASVILRGVIVTAAHCIQDFGSGDTIFTNFVFLPGHYGAADATEEQIAPYGTFVPFAVSRPQSWSDGTDPGCGAARENDLAVMAVPRNAEGQLIGDIVGMLNYGWNNLGFVSSPRTGDLNTAAISTLGYPGLMDGGAIMQRTDGPTFTTTFCGDATTAEIPQLWQGSNLTGGASGGPWTVNFSGRNAVLSGGAVEGEQAIMAVVGVTSWGTADPNTPKDNFSSQFGQNTQYPEPDYGGFGAGNIGSLINSLCSGPAPEGGTLASAGYCD
ncbi:MAG: trypsin-like serine peptidase [Geminicoccales bacterium]